MPCVRGLNGVKLPTSEAATCACSITAHVWLGARDVDGATLRDAETHLVPDVPSPTCQLHIKTVFCFFLLSIDAIAWCTD